jgi:hypothetical protein
LVILGRDDCLGAVRLVVAGVTRGGGREAAGTDGPRECRGGGRIVEWAVLGVVPVSKVRCRAGVTGFLRTRVALAEASDNGGEGGDVCTVDVFDLVGGGVDAVGEDTVVALVDASDAGEGGPSAAIVLGLRL